MPVTRRICVSLPADPWLPDNLNALKWGIVEEIEKLGYTPEIFTNPKGRPGLASAKAWSPRDANEIARRYSGVVYQKPIDDFSRQIMRLSGARPS